MQTLNRL